MLRMKKKKKDNKSSICFEIEFFERLIKSKPDFVDALIPLAEAYTRAGCYRKGLAIDKRLSRLKSDDAVVYYNLGCSYSLLGKIDEAYAALEKAVDLGYEDFEHMAIDSDLLNVRKDKRYNNIISHWKKMKRS